jgi:hypothetical protein
MPDIRLESMELAESKGYSRDARAGKHALRFHGIIKGYAFGQ